MVFEKKIITIHSTMSKITIFYYSKAKPGKLQSDGLYINQDETVKDVILRSNAYKAMTRRFYVMFPAFQEITSTDLEQKAVSSPRSWTLKSVSANSRRTNLIDPPNTQKRTREETEQKFKQQIVHDLKDTERVFKKYCQEVDRFIDQAKQAKVRQDNVIKELNDEITGLEQVVRDLKRKK